jgi:hypothetical protein
LVVRQADPEATGLSQLRREAAHEAGDYLGDVQKSFMYRSRSNSDPIPNVLVKSFMYRSRSTLGFDPEWGG